MIKTGRIGYTSKKPGKYYLDITVKHNPNHVFSTTWDLVLGLKRQQLTWAEYEAQYMETMRGRWHTRRADILQVVQWSKERDVVLMCFCPKTARCHRDLAAKIVKTLIRKGY